MRLEKLTVENYKCFEKLSIQFDGQLTVIVGENGAGKSAVLDAASVAIGALMLGFMDLPANGIYPDDVRIVSHRIGKTYEMQPQYPTKVIADGEVNGQPIHWERSLNGTNGKTTTVNAKQITDTSNAMQQRVTKGDQTLILPIISYYGTGRLWAQKRQKRDMEAVAQFTRLSGYIDCLDVRSNEKLMNQWFEKMTLIALQEKEENPEFRAVQYAMEKLFSRITGFDGVKVEYSILSGNLELQYVDKNQSYHRMPLKLMSDGYRNTISLIADIAYRMAILNPQLQKYAICDTPGVVLIDEVDLHLHPNWQQRILRDLTDTFPKVQFIVTTHAPSVINTIDNENLVILDRHEAYYPNEPTRGRDANGILEDIMGAKKRLPEIDLLFDEFYTHLDNENLDRAKEQLKELIQTLGENDAEIAGAKVALNFQEMQVGLESEDIGPTDEGQEGCLLDTD